MRLGIFGRVFEWMARVGEKSYEGYASQISSYVLMASEAYEQASVRSVQSRKHDGTAKVLVRVKA